MSSSEHHRKGAVSYQIFPVELVFSNAFHRLSKVESSSVNPRVSELRVSGICLCAVDLYSTGELDPSIAFHQLLRTQTI